MGRMQGLLAVVCVASLAACTPGALDGLGPVTPKPSPSASNPLFAVGSALQVGQEAVEAKAKAWAGDAQLVGIKGYAIDGAGVDSANDSRWVYTYRSASQAATVTFTASPAGLKGPATVADDPNAKAVGTVSMDTDDAVLRYKTIAKASTLDRFNVTLQTSGATPVWLVEVVDELGKTQESGTVNADTGNVTIA